MDPIAPFAIAPFAIARLPRIVFGAGAIDRLPAEITALGRRALVVTGARSFRAGHHWRVLLEHLAADGVAVSTLACGSEPSPEFVDGAVASLAGAAIDVVVGIGGGSALDAAKAIAGMLPHRHSVTRHLEGLAGQQPYPGGALPWIAVPTTAGTGSEATKNAVLSRIGPDGYKRSFRDEALVARVALVDPELLATCPPAVVAANGLDAFTQLLESYTSTNANPLTDALALSGIEAFAQGFFAAWQGGVGAGAAAARTRMAYAALVSGICLAQTGLGAVHGLASPLGAFFPIPHGVCCGTLVARATAVNVAALTARRPDSPALAKYARIAEVLTGTRFADAGRAHTALIALLDGWTTRLDLPVLSAFGITEADIPRVVAGSRGSSMRTNPIVLDDTEIAAIVAARLR
jgi:alcohol dehydrogenase